jgi:hypothetical protein
MHGICVGWKALGLAQYPVLERHGLRRAGPEDFVFSVHWAPIKMTMRVLSSRLPAGGRARHLDYVLRIERRIDSNRVCVMGHI